MILIDFLTDVLDKSHKKAKTLLTKGAIYVNGKNITKLQWINRVFASKEPGTIYKNDSKL